MTGNVTSLRNKLPVDDLLTKVYHEGPGKVPRGGEADEVMPALLAKVLPLHQVVAVDAYIPGCPPDPERIWVAVCRCWRGSGRAVRGHAKVWLIRFGSHSWRCNRYLGPPGRWSVLTRSTPERTRRIVEENRSMVCHAR